MDPQDIPTTLNRLRRSSQESSASNSDLLSRTSVRGDITAGQDVIRQSPLTPTIGDCVDNCRIVAELGSGGSGQAFLARQEALANRPIVLKVTRTTSCHEDLNLARLQHTNIMPLYWANTLPELGIRVLAMPYLGRSTLANLLDRMRRAPDEDWTGARVFQVLETEQLQMPMQISVLPHLAATLKQVTWIEFVVQVGRAVAGALAYAHQRGLVHHDLKPANILITPDGQPIILDLGVARQPIAKGTERVPWLGGTWLYMSPEQRLAVDAMQNLEPIPCAVDGRSDLYSLGLVLAHALAGKHGEGSPPDPRMLTELNPDVSPGLADIVARCLAENPDHRYPDGDSLAEDLRRHLQDLPLVGVRNCWSERVRKWRRRRPLGLALIFVVVAFCVTAGIAGFSIYERNEDRRREAEAALHDGQEQQRLGQYDAAISRFIAGKELADQIPGAGALQLELNQRLQQSRRLQMASELDKVVSQMRFYALQDHMPRRLQWVLEGAGRKLWAERAVLVDLSAGTLEHAVETTIKSRLQELVILWTDLHVRVTPAEQAEQARHEAREMLAEAERMFGVSLGLSLAHEQLGKESPEGRPQPQAAWEYCALARQALNRNDTATAIQFCRSALDLEPLGLVPNFYYGVCAMRHNNFEHAVRAFSFCVGQTPCAECFMLRGQAFVGLGEFESALKDFNLAVKLNPELGITYQHRGNLYHKLGRHVEAEQDLKLAKKLGE